MARIFVTSVPPGLESWLSIVSGLDLKSGWRNRSRLITKRFVS